ncbi:hypothetical protein [Pseudonocardia lacus]|uniref:hypothetical protein n=1 Tax=Pseudonocardia lacus TaxID=2835865 RepID=UPI001BDCD2DF|nr:hypothetical protein [Pseudonocardia lacus]
MTLARTARLVRPARTSVPPGTRFVLAGSAVAWVALPLWTVGAGHGGAVEPWRAGWLLTWLLMVVAMMWPLAAPALAVVTGRAFRAWRVRLVATCLGVFTLLWVAAGLAVAVAAHVLAVPAAGGVWALGWVLVALVAGRSARRARLLWKCTEVPGVAPGGARGLASAAIAGAVAWRRCALLCGPVMTAMVLAHDPLLMLGASAAAWWEAAHPRAWRDPVPALLLAAVAAWLLLGVVGSR